jgi:DNA-binding response OmpR family regulator
MVGHMSRPTVLVVEDDAAIRRGIVDALGFAGYRVFESDGARGVPELAAEHGADLVLLDVMLPARSGFEILGDLRRSQPALPVIMVTARGAEDDRVRGLDGGADDYVVKPFSARELLARVDAVLRRSPQRPSPARRLGLDGRGVDLERREARLAGEVRALTELETAILLYLAAHRRRAVGRAELLQHVWGLNPRGIRTRTVDMHVARLREKIGDGAGGADFVSTVRGKGYALGDRVEVDPP